MIDGVFPTKATDEGLFKMSVKELKFDTGLTKFRVNTSGDLLVLTTDIEDKFNNKNDSMCSCLDRNQAHLLYLYLKERFEPK